MFTKDRAVAHELVLQSFTCWLLLAIPAAEASLTGPIRIDDADGYDATDETFSDDHTQIATQYCDDFDRVRETVGGDRGPSSPRSPIAAPTGKRPSSGVAEHNARADNEFG